MHLRDASELDDVLADGGVGSRLGYPVSRLKLLELCQKELCSDRRHTQHRELHEIGLVINHDCVICLRDRFLRPGAVPVCRDEYRAWSDQPAVRGRPGLDYRAHSVSAEVQGQLGPKPVETANQMDIRGVNGRCMHLDQQLAGIRLPCLARHKAHRVERVPEPG